MRTWEETPDAEKTFSNTKKHLNIARRRYRNDQNTTKAAGFHSANAALVEENTDAIKSGPILSSCGSPEL